MELFPDHVVVADLVVHRDLVPHPLLGQAHVIEHAGRPLTAMTRFDWDRPEEIPALASPGRLPPGTGGALLNAIAVRAQQLGVPALRYAGPYPTPALYRTLMRSFRASAPEEVFTADVLGRAMRLARDPIPVDFTPAPHRRVAWPVGFVELRDGPLRAVIEGISYEPGGSPGRLVPHGAGWAAEVWFGDAPWARVAELDATGALVSGPHAIAPATSDVVGQVFPPALRAALGELVAELVPAPLARAATSAIGARPIAWADLGGRAARRAGDGFEVHAALWERLAPHGLARVALALAEALAPVVTSALVAELSASTSS